MNFQPMMAALGVVHSSASIALTGPTKAESILKIRFILSSVSRDPARNYSEYLDKHVGFAGLTRGRDPSTSGCMAARSSLRASRLRVSPTPA
jgi:hypothetical protein